jgi:hypothetical protein
MSSPSQPENLWNNTFKPFICDDLSFKLQTKYYIQNPTEDMVYDFGLYQIDNILHQSGRSLSEFPTMPQWSHHWEDTLDNRLIYEQTNYNTQEELLNTQTNLEKFNPEQQAAFDTIMQVVDQQQLGKLFFCQWSRWHWQVFSLEYNCPFMSLQGLHCTLCCIIWNCCNDSERW